VIRAHQPGSEPIDIPETIPNPVVVPKPNTYSDRTHSQGAGSDPGEGSLGRRLNGRHLYAWRAVDSEGEALLVLPQGIAHSPSS